MKPIKSALISVYSKENLAPVVEKLHELGVEIYSTGGTYEFIANLNIPVTAVENLTSYPSILGGRVKTLHPKIFGGILGRRELSEDLAQLDEYSIPQIDLVIVDLYPFEETVKSGGTESEIIEKIDIGGISLIRAAAKNYRDVVVISSQSQYGSLLELLREKAGTDLDDRKHFALGAFDVSSQYDTSIFNYFDQDSFSTFKQQFRKKQSLRYGENPHQQGVFFGDLDEVFEKIQGKDLSYNNLLDVDAGVNLMEEFKTGQATFAILKHNNACGVATRETLVQAYTDALAGDPVSAFGGVLFSNIEIDKATAEKIADLFFEIIVAPGYSSEALEILSQKKNRIILKQKPCKFPKRTYRTILNGVLMQDRDLITDEPRDFDQVTLRAVDPARAEDLAFANKIAKHTKSNTIVLAKNQQLLGSGTGQTSRVDALRQAIGKAKNFKFDLKGAVMASDAFFPFPDCVEIAHKEGIDHVIQPGGSIKDKLSIDYCNENNIAMVFTGNRHFKH